jgi:transposase
LFLPIAESHMLTPPFLSDLQWSLLQPLFSASSRGRPPLSHRLFLEIILLKLVTGLPWYSLPTTSPSWQACYQRYHRWQVDGTWSSILRTLLADLSTRGGFDLLSAIQNHQILFDCDASGQPLVTFPPEIENSWQQSTTLLLVHLLATIRTS